MRLPRGITMKKKSEDGCITYDFLKQSRHWFSVESYNTLGSARVVYVYAPQGRSRPKEFEASKPAFQFVQRRLDRYRSKTKLKTASVINNNRLR